MSQPGPVVIVGAGPTGLTAALELSRFGVPVRLIDRRAEPTTTSRALAVQSRTVELFDARGLGAEMTRIGHPAVGVSIHGDGHRLAHIDLTAIPSRHNSILMLSQAETEWLLREQVARQGVTIERGVELVALAQDGSTTHDDPAEGLRAVLLDANGTLEVVEPAALIVAEGAHSLVRRTLNLPFAGRSLAQSYALADVHAESQISDDEISTFVNRDGLLAMFPMGSGRFRVIASDPAPHDSTAPPPDLAEIQRLYDDHSHIPARFHELVWSSRFRINSRMLAHLRDRRIFFGGDSAHVHSPVGGQGMNTGIQDMINLGWKLALVLQGRGHADLLDTYEEERLPIIKQVVHRTETATDALNSRSRLVQTLLNHLAPWLLGSETVQHIGVGQISQVDHHYRGGSLARSHPGHGAFRAGDRVPDGPVSVIEPDGSTRVADLQSLLDPTGLTLLRTGEATGNFPVPSVRIAPASPSRADAVFGPDAGLILVRPDGYAGFVGRAGDQGDLVAWLGRWFPGWIAQG